jgi:hypothetical protein
MEEYGHLRLLHFGVGPHSTCIFAVVVDLSSLLDIDPSLSSFEYFFPLKYQELLLMCVGNQINEGKFNV